MTSAATCTNFNLICKLIQYFSHGAMATVSIFLEDPDFQVLVIRQDFTVIAYQLHNMFQSQDVETILCTYISQNYSNVTTLIVLMNARRTQLLNINFLACSKAEI